MLIRASHTAVSEMYTVSSGVLQGGAAGWTSGEDFRDT